MCVNCDRSSVSARIAAVRITSIERTRASIIAVSGHLHLQNNILRAVLLTGARSLFLKEVGDGHVEKFGEFFQSATG
jgi:hypothetical protein